MFYLLQKKDETQLELEISIVQELLDSNKYLHSYNFCYKEQVANFVAQKGIPVGDIDFVTEYLQKAYNFKGNMFPIEIPKCLRTEEFLGRFYEIVTSSQLRGLSSRYFIKNVSKLKNMACIGYPETMVVPKRQLFAISGIIDILSEYRVYVFEDKIVSIANYSGSVTAFPDIAKIKKMITVYAIQDPDRPKAYTLDVFVTHKHETLILEVHNFVSCGLYSTIWDSKLLNMYTAGIDHVLKHNCLVKK